MNSLLCLLNRRGIHCTPHNKEFIAHTLQLSRRFLDLARNLVDDVHHMDRLLTPTRHMISHLWPSCLAEMEEADLLGELRAAGQSRCDAAVHRLRLVGESVLIRVAPLPALVCNQACQATGDLRDGQFAQASSHSVVPPASLQRLPAGAGLPAGPGSGYSNRCVRGHTSSPSPSGV